jgi:hypothetical protein
MLYEVSFVSVLSAWSHILVKYLLDYGQFHSRLMNCYTLMVKLI